jgi:hypothetical protein
MGTLPWHTLTQGAPILLLSQSGGHRCISFEGDSVCRPSSICVCAWGVCVCYKQRGGNRRRAQSARINRAPCKKQSTKATAITRATTPHSSITKASYKPGTTESTPSATSTTEQGRPQPKAPPQTCSSNPELTTTRTTTIGRAQRPASPQCPGSVCVWVVRVCVCCVVLKSDPSARGNRKIQHSAQLARVETKKTVLASFCQELKWKDEHTVIRDTTVSTRARIQTDRQHSTAI